MAKPASQVENAMDNIPYYEKWQTRRRDTHR